MEKEINSLGSVYVEKSQLLEIVKKNKEKHDIIYSGALEGYNAAVNNYLKKVESETERIKNLAIEYSKAESHGKVFDKTGLYLIRCDIPSSPVSYAFDYEKTIKKLELSTAEKISLMDNEFNQYVMNNWSWKTSFLASNVGYCSGFAGTLLRTDVNQFGQLAAIDRSITDF
jgi:hypothetical protein